MKIPYLSKRRALVAGTLLATGVVASAVNFFFDNFDVDSSSVYTVTADPDTLAVFAYDYSAMGIPAAPNSAGGTTRGIRLEANNGDATAAVAAISLSPTGLNLTGDYTLRFDVWLNANGSFPAGGTGSTQFVTAGVGTAGGTVHKNNVGDGTWTAVDNEGNSSIDYRVFLNGTLQAPASGFYTAGTGADARDANNGYYSNYFFGQAAPQFQQDNYPQQVGTMKNGAIGFAWRQVEITKIGTDVTWSIDGLQIAMVQNAPLSGSNVFFGWWDPFTSISDNPALTFGVIDNVRVDSLPIPEPSTAALALLGATAMMGMRRFRRFAE